MQYTARQAQHFTPRNMEEAENRHRVSELLDCGFNSEEIKILMRDEEWPIQRQIDGLRELSDHECQQRQKQCSARLDELAAAVGLE